MPSGNVPSVFTTFRTQQNPYFPIHHKKTPQYAKVQPESVDFPSGHATFPTLPSETLIFANAIQSFTKSLSEVLESSSQEETQSAKGENQVPITKETAKTLKEAFETLQSQLQKGIESLPETNQPLPKTLLQALVQTPLFIEQLRELLQKISPKRPVIEEAEISVEFPLETKEVEKPLVEDLRQNIPHFVKTLQTALKELPPSLPPEIKESLEKYLSVPPLEKTVSSLKVPLTEESPPKGKISEKKEEIQKPLLEKPLFLVEESIREVPKKEILKPPLAEKKEPLEKTFLGEVKELEAAFIRQAPVLLVKKGNLQKEELPALPEPLQKKETGRVITKEKALEPEKPLLKLPEVILKEILENFYPLLKATLALLENQHFLPKEFLALLKQIPELVKQIEFLLKPKTFLNEGEKKAITALIKGLPTLFNVIEKKSFELPESLFSAPLLRKLIRKIPLHKIIPLLEKRIEILSNIKPVLEQEGVSFPKTEPNKETIKTPIPEQEPLTKTYLEQPLIETFLQEEIELLEEEVEVLEKTSLSELEKGLAKEKIEQNEEEERIENQKLNGNQSPRSVPLFTVEQFKEKINPSLSETQFSTDIPFAFIVPYVPNTPIHTNLKEPKISPEDPRKEIKEGTEGVGSKKSMQMLSYIPKGETLEGNPYKENGARKFILDSYAIGVYLVTNEQFAAFLTEESKAKNIYVKDRGEVFSKNGTLLCQLKSGREDSDIEAEPEPNYLSFRACDEKGSYPVVCVTYEGAKAFCESGGFRLPTESEWEKAASLEMTEKNQVARKYIFGFSQDEISPAFANYNAKITSSFENHTTPVGFYDGKTTFMKEGSLVQTFDARSPFGCYDMSGNVWEWTEAKEGSHALTKGGSFGGSEEDLKVFSKRRKERNSLDGYTGFRVALS